jgi:hypothetical protein
MTDRDSSTSVRRLSRWGRWGIVVWLGTLLALPPLLLAAGQRPALVEQRLPAEAPGFSAGRLLDTAWYGQIADWFADRLPWRDRAIEADALIDYVLFRESPSPRVRIGSDGWLFLRDDFAVPCHPAGSVRAAVDEVALLDRALQAAGKQLLFIVAPDKSAVYPDRLGRLAAETGCALANRATFREQLAEAGIDGYLDTWAVLEAAAAGPRPAYHRLDTHWNDFGAGAVAAAAVERFAPGRWDPGDFVLVGSESRVGDLGRLMGLSLREDAEVWQVHRAEEPSLMTEPVSRTIEAVTSTMESDLAIGLSALMVHDSMGNALAPLLRPYFSSLTTVRALGVRAPFAADPAWFEGALGEADVLIVVKVERVGLQRLQGGLADAVVGALADLLPHREIALARGLTGADLGTRWARNTGEIVTTGRVEALVPLSLPFAEPGAHRFLVVHLQPKGRLEVRLTWVDPADGGTRELVDVVPAGAATATFDLSAVGAAPEVELHLGTAPGRRLSKIAVVEVPAADGA